MQVAISSIHPEELRLATQQPGSGVGAGISVAVLSQDESLLKFLSDVITADHTISISPGPESLAEQIIATNAGVALVDSSALAGDSAVFLASLRTQFPDLVLIAAGDTSQQSHLAGMITSGEIYRFLHKPVSEQRARLFVDAALRRYDELRASANKPETMVAPRTPTLGSAPGLPPKILAGLLLGTVLIAAAWFGLRKPASPEVAVTATAPVAADVRRALSPAAESRLQELLDQAEVAVGKAQPAEATRLLNQARALEANTMRAPRICRRSWASNVNVTRSCKRVRPRQTAIMVAPWPRWTALPPVIPARLTKPDVA